MISTRSLIRTGAAASVVALGLSLAACSGPAGTVGGSCPEGFVDQVNAAAVEQDLGVTFTSSSVASFVPAELQTFLGGACVLGFDGDADTGLASGSFAFVTTAIDEAKFSEAVEALGYEGESGSWIKTDPAQPNDATVITESAPSGNGSLLDLTTIYPDVKTVIASFKITVS